MGSLVSNELLFACLNCLFVFCLFVVVVVVVVYNLSFERTMS
jgi:hypothetical protein